MKATTYHNGILTIIAALLLAILFRLPSTPVHAQEDDAYRVVTIREPADVEAALNKASQGDDLVGFTTMNPVTNLALHTFVFKK